MMMLCYPTITYLVVNGGVNWGDVLIGGKNYCLENAFENCVCIELFE
jgi:hypothetical protein